MIEAESEITLFYVSEIDRTIRYYLLQAASAAPPKKPTAYPPGGNWQTLEPEYIASSTNSLYFTDLTILTNGDFSYSEVSKSSSYEAAKDAWNKADSITGDVTALKEWQVKASSLITKDGIINTVGNYYATTALVDGVTTRVAEAESIIKQHSDSIEMTVKKDGVISAINQTSESVKISADKISLTAAGLVEIINGGTTKISADKLNLSGYVTISSLSGAGTSTIDGSNIKTGKISTDRLDVNSIFAKDVTATGTITGATLKGGSFICSGVNGMFALEKGELYGIYESESADGMYKNTYESHHLPTFSQFVQTTLKRSDSTKSTTTVFLGTSGLNVNGMFTVSTEDGEAHFRCPVYTENTFQAAGISAGNIYCDGKVSLKSGIEVANAGVELTAATPYIDFHFGNTTTDYTSRIIELEKGKLNINGAVFTNGGTIWGKGLSIDGTGTFNGDLSTIRGLKLNYGGTSLYLYNESGKFCMMHTGTDGTSTWPIVWDFKNDNLAIANSINCGAYGTFGKGIISKSESVFHTGSYTDPYPGVACTIKSWGTIASLRYKAKGQSTSWLGGAQPAGASYDTICTDANALVPGWRIRSADGAWVGASYAQNHGFCIYYCNASRLAGSTNGTDAMYTFGASGTFYAKSVSQTSDEREKNIISGITEKYEDLFMQLRPVLFSWKSGADGIHMGFGAQTTLEMAEQCGISADELAAVHRSETEEPWSMSYTEIVPLTVQMTQKALLTLDSTRKEVSALGQNMTARMESLQYQLAQAFDRIAVLEKENKSLRQALS